MGALMASSAYAASPLAGAIGLTYSSGIPGTFTLAPSAQPVTVTSGGTTTTFPAGSPITYTSGATITVGGLSFAITGTPANGDQFTITPNSSNGSSDNRNGLLLAGLQSQGTLNNSKTSYSDAFGQLVNTVGNKARELKVIGVTEAKVLEQATAAVQSESGVNLDEEATNLLRYQQAYQAAGKMMQIASQLFDVLLQLG
jgi:flagellar hook-associated protein 1 FlgK